MDVFYRAQERLFPVPFYNLAWQSDKVVKWLRKKQ